MAYAKQTWADGSAGNTPVNAARLQHIEDGLFAAAGIADAAETPAAVAAAIATQHTTDNNTYIPLAGMTSVDTLSKGPLLGFPEGPTGDGQHFEIRKNATDALDYFGTGTKAALVIQQRDPEDLATNGFSPGIVFQFESVGQGAVSGVGGNSTSIWQGLFGIFKKFGDGSGQVFTATGELHGSGTVGYGEIGLFQGVAHNFGVTGGNLSGCEVVVGDSPDNGTTHYPSKMKALVPRVAKYDSSRTYPSAAIYPSSEGTIGPDAIMKLNPSPSNVWNSGLDLSAGSFTTGVVFISPNNVSFNWKDGSGNAQTIFGVTAANVTYIRPASAAAHISLEAFDGTECFQIGGTNGGTLINAKSGSPLIVQVAGSTVFSITSGGAINTVAANETTGAATPALGTNSPATVTTAPYKWLIFKTSDGTVVYVPAWK